MDFPLLSHDDPEHYSEKHGVGCAVCHRKSFVPNSFIELSGGISDYATVLDGQSVNLNISCFPAYDNADGSNAAKHIAIIENHMFGQFRLRFCSKNCIATFFSSILSAIPDDD